MASNDNGRRKRLHDELIALRAAAITALEQRGYDVRGKTPAQIRELTRRRGKRAAQFSVPPRIETFCHDGPDQPQ